MDTQYIEDMFSYHPPKHEKIALLHEQIRAELKTSAHVLNNSLSESPEKTLAIRHLQQAMMYANAAIAIYSDGK